MIVSNNNIIHIFIIYLVWKEKSYVRKPTTNISYPLPDLRGVPIFNSISKELIYIYLPEVYLEKLTKSMTLKGNHFYDNDNIDSLNIIICEYLNDTFQNCPLEFRLKKSYLNNMMNIFPSYGFIIMPDENFLNKAEVRQILGNFRELKNQILKNQNVTNDDSFMNPFMKEEKNEDESDKEEEEFEEDYEYMDLNIWEIYHKLKKLKESKCLPKKGVSLLTKQEKQIIKNKSSFKGIKKIRSVDKITIHKSTFSFGDIKVRKKNQDKYTKLIKEIFCDKLNDFRSEIIIYCLKHSDIDILINDSFEKFVCFLEFFISLFTGIKTKYYLDELTNLNMDFYADERNLMNYAETFRYKVQFKIKDIPIIYDSELKIYRKRDNTLVNKDNFHITKFNEINELNKVQFEQVNLTQVEYFPPYTKFIKELSAHYRRYDINDRIHLCNECKNINNYTQCLEVKCRSSCFKALDKERLIYRNLMTIMNEENIDDCWIIKDNVLLLNYKSIIDNTGFFYLIFTFLAPVETVELKRVNKIYNNLFGEAIGFYFIWITHYIKWLIFPSIFGLILHIIFLNRRISETIYELVLTLIFTATIVLWGNYYVLSWKKKNKFYNYIWGVNDFKLKKVINTDNRVSVNRINFMGVKLPQAISYKNHITNALILFLSALIKIAVMGSNIFILMFKNHNFDLKTMFYNKLLNKYWKYITPVIIYILRELFSIFSEKANIWLYSHQKFISEEEKEKMLVRKKLLFEFFNYYFNLYYIAFLKKKYEKCLYDNCYTELEQQLIMIILSDATVMCVKFYTNAISLRKEINKFEKEIQAKFSYLENPSNKFRYYTRYSFRNKTIVEYYIKIFLTFGYILQFGACCPLSFILVLFITILTRVTLGISLRDIYYAQIYDENTGLAIINQAQELISFIGIISNLFIIFYTNNNFVKIKTSNKFFYMILTENIIILITKFFEPFNLPNWFPYRNKIGLQYYRKYGTRKKKIEQIK